MEFRKKEWRQETKILIDSRRQKWRYIRAKDMQERYPNGGYFVLADLKKGKKEDVIGHLIQGDKRIEVFAYKAKLSVGETGIGFLRIEDDRHKDTFVRIVKRKKSQLFVPLLLLLLVLGTGAGYWKSRSAAPDLEQSAISYHVEGMKNEDPSNISIPLFAQFWVNAGSMRVEERLANPEGNPCYFEYHIFLQGESQELYRSGLLEPGTAVPGFTLDRKLEAGNYPAKVQIKTYQLQNPTVPMNGGEIDVMLIVEEE